jgi:hypothetical protein
MSDADDLSSTPGSRAGTDQNVGAMSNEGPGAMTESLEAQQAKAEALEHARAARMAAARYARLSPSSVHTHNSEVKEMDDTSGAMKELHHRVSRTEMALTADVVVEQLQRAFLSDGHDRAQRLIGTAAAWVPILFLEPEPRGGGFGGFATHPRTYSAGLLAAIALVKELMVQDRTGKEEDGAGDGSTRESDTRGVMPGSAVGLAESSGDALDAGRSQQKKSADVAQPK